MPPWPSTIKSELRTSLCPLCSRWPQSPRESCPSRCPVEIPFSLLAAPLLQVFRVFRGPLVYLPAPRANPYSIFAQGLCTADAPRHRPPSPGPTPHMTVCPRSTVGPTRKTQDARSARVVTQRTLSKKKLPDGEWEYFVLTRRALITNVKTHTTSPVDEDL